MVAFIDLMQRVDVHMVQKVLDERLPPMPRDEARQQALIMREPEVERRRDQPHVRHEEAASRLVQLQVPANVLVPEVIGQHPFRQRLEHQAAGEFEQVQVHLLGDEDVHAHHLVAVQWACAHGPAGHPEMGVDPVQTRQVQIFHEELGDGVTGKHDIVASAGNGRERVEVGQRQVGGRLEHGLRARVGDAIGERGVRCREGGCGRGGRDRASRKGRRQSNGDGRVVVGSRSRHCRRRLQIRHANVL